MGKYNIERLGWFNFERLITTLLRQVVGSGLSSFSGSSDQGRDATYEGKACFPSKDNGLDGKWIFQVKFREYQNKSVTQTKSELNSTLQSELVKITKKYHHELDIYVFVTNCPLTADDIDEFKGIIESNSDIEYGFIVAAQDIEELLDLHPKVVRAFPQIMGIGQLRELINWGISQRSIEYLLQVQQDLDTFVVTKPYIDSLELLNKQHFCVLTGAPKMGKTCNADALAAAHAADGYSVYDLRNQRDFYDMHDSECKQLFICDDVFGDISLQADKKDEWTRSLKRLLRSLDGSHKLVWTARSYILQEAIDNSKLLEDRPKFEYDKIVVNIENLTELEKAIILYNHAKKANLPERIKAILKKECKSIVKSKYFAPESIRQLCTGEIVKFSEQSDDDNEVISQIYAFLKSPGRSWQNAYKGAPAFVQYICLQIMAEGGIVPYNTLASKYEEEVKTNGHTWIPFEDAFAWAEGTFLKRRQSRSDVYVQFYHPSMRDLLTELIQNDKVSRQTYIEKMSIGEFSNLITAIKTSEKESSQEHKVLITDEDDIQLLSLYIKEKIVGEYDYDKILTVLSELLSFIKKNSYEMLPRIGQIALYEISQIICNKEFWEHNHSKLLNNPLTYLKFEDMTYYEQGLISKLCSNKCETWKDILIKIKFIINNTPFTIFPEYIGELLQYFINYENIDFWKIAVLCRELSEVITLKYVDFKKRFQLKEKLTEDVAQAINYSPDGFDSDYESCEAWHDEYDDIFNEANEYIKVFPDDEIDDIDELESLMEEYSVYEHEPDYDRDDFGLYSTGSFDIGEIFKDL